MVFGGTNRINTMDPALRRGGRFDREIEIGIPNKESRLEIIRVHTRGMPLDQGIDLSYIANITHGFVGADLSSLAKEAAMNALRRILPDLDLDQESIPAEVLEKLFITQEDLSKSLSDVQPSALREVFVDVPNVKWEDIGGLKDVKDQLRETVEWPLKYSKIYKHMKANQPKGVLLYGPPGTGKTLIAKAIANESEANFISIKGPEFLSKWVGESERAVREVFRKARQAAPCIIFFDEIETISQTRGNMGESNETERVISQILTELDGLEELHGVMIIAATNRPDIIDPALLRPGRFDKIIEITLPKSIEDRMEIFKIHLKGRPVADINLKALAELTDGFNGADIAAICDEAVVLTIKNLVSNLSNDKIEEIDNLEDEEVANYLKGSSVSLAYFKQAIDKIKTTKDRLKQTQLTISQPSSEYF